jgi:hypothetical protein
VERALRQAIAMCAALTAVLVPGAGAARAQIPGDPTAGEVPAFVGAPAEPRRIAGAEPPRHPFMAPNGRSSLHDDAFQTDVYWTAGPLGRDMEVRSTFQSADCASVTFDSRGRIVTVCVGFEGPRLELLDARTLAEIARMQLPPRMPGTGSVFNDFAGGGYFYLDNRDRAVVPTTTRHVLVVAVRDGSFAVERDHDVSSRLASADKIISALPDWSGRIWFASVEGVMGTIDPQSGAVRTRDLGEDISNSFAVDDEGSVYAVTQKALYRLDAAADGTPAVTWRQEYENSGIAKPGQVHAGSGTTPTVMEGGRVAIADNADPMNVVVYRKAKSLSGSREVCRAAVFRKGASATDQSLIAVRNSIVTENNYGYTGPTSTSDGRTTSPGLQRVDVQRGRCVTRWRSDEVAPTVVPKLSLETGLVYSYTHPARDDGNDAWYLTALDFCTGRTVYKRLAGTGLGYNNNYAPVTLGPDGSAYVGVLGGLVLLRDARTPAGPPSSAPKGCSPRPRLALRLRFRRGRQRRRSCARPPVRAAVAGPDAGSIARVDFRLGRRRVRLDRSAPFGVVVDRTRHVGRRHAHRVRAGVLMSDGRRLTLRRRFVPCLSG